MTPSNRSWRFAGALTGMLLVAACVGSAAAYSRVEAGEGDAASVAQRGGASDERLEQVRRGRTLTMNHACSGCHGGSDPASEGYLAGMRSPDQEFKIGPCAIDANAKPCFNTRPRNLTPDNTTGLGRFSERQLFNSLRFGLRPGETPDVEITSTVAGQGNHPANPKYLAPPMPWPAWRYMSDQELWDIAAYLKYGVKPVRNRVADSDGPPDFWASEYTPAKIGAYPLPSYPTANERLP